MTTATKKKSSNKIKLQPLGDRVVVEREAVRGATRPAGSSCRTRPRTSRLAGTVVSVGDGKLLDDGTPQRRCRSRSATA